MLSMILARFCARKTWPVSDPTDFGVVEWNGHEATSIEEKPVSPTSSLAVTGLYLYDSDVLTIAAELKPSARGELEVTDINRAYLLRGKLVVEHLGDSFTWIDMGTPERLLEASNLVAALQSRDDTVVGCLEVIAYQQRLVSEAQLATLSDKIGEKSAYGKFIARALSNTKLSKV